MIATQFAEVFRSLAAGDRFMGLSAHGDELWNAPLPDEPLYDSHVRHRQNALAPAWAEAMAYLEGTISAQGHDTQVDYSLVLHAALRYRVADDTHVAFYGNPLWDGADTFSAFALHEAYPTDAHVAMDRATTPFGRALDEPLDGVGIHFCLVEPGQFLSGAHQEGVQKTYGLMAAEAGAQLATFSADVAQCSRRFASGDRSNAPHFEADPKETRFGMISGDVNISRATPIAPSNASPELAAAIQSGTVEMVRLRIYDNAGEDGDIVTLLAPGYSRTVTLTNAGEIFEVPLVHGDMMLRGDHDGGGGITVSISLPDGTHIIDGTMDEGKQIALTVPQ